MKDISSASVEKFGYKRELTPVLGLWDLVVYGLVFMLPIGPFALFGIVSDASAGMAPLAYLLGAIVMGFTAHSYALLSSAFPVAGSVYTYSRFGLNEHAGFFAGWLVLLDYLLGPGLLYVVSAAALHGLVPAIPRWSWIIVFVIVGTGMNLFGVKFNARVNKLMLITMMVVLAVFMIAGLLALEAGKGRGGLTFTAFFNPQSFTWKAMSAGILISSVNYLGFDATTTLGEEVENTERKPMGKACMLTLALMAIMSVGQAWVAQDLLPGAAIVSADTAFYDISRYIGGDWLYSLTSISTALGYGIACSIVGQAAISRILFAMGRDGLLLQAFAKVHPKTHQPYVANLFVGAVSLGVALGFANHLDEIVLFQNFGALTAFSFVNLAVIGYFWVKHKSGRVVRHLVIPACGIVMIAYLLTSMRPATLTLGVLWLALGLLYYFVITRLLGRRAALEV